MSAPFDRNGAELRQHPYERTGDPVRANAARGDVVLPSGRLAQGRDSEVAERAVVLLGDLIDPGALPSGQQPLDFRVYRQAVLLVEVRRVRGGAQERAGLLEVVQKRVH